jgi:uncharacterized protein
MAETFEQIDSTFTHNQNRLAGLLVRPTDHPPTAAVVLVHGSGPADRDSNGAFVALRTFFASQGCAVFCYDKPGVGASTGDWTRQTFYDRAEEVRAAVGHLQAELNSDLPVGLCGGSQAGWVMPIVAYLQPALAFIVSISAAAVTPAEQEAYRIEWALRAAGFGKVEIDEALAVFRRRIAMIDAGRPNAEIAAKQNEASDEAWFPHLADLTEDDITFFRAIYNFSARSFLEQVRCPFLGLWGALDRIVPVAESIENTRLALEAAGNGNYQLKTIANANHGMRLVTADNPGQPAGIAPDLLETMSEWLASLKPFLHAEG